MTRKTTSLLLLWILVTGLGLTVGLAIGLWLKTDEDSLPIFLLLGFVLSGALIGFGQWTLLHTDYKRSWLWTPATTVGIAIGLPIGILVSDLVLPLVIEESSWSYFILTALIAGTITGAMQWLFTGKKLVSAKWVFVSTISFLGLVFSYASLDNPIYTLDLPSWTLGVLVFGSLFGIFTGTISGIFILSSLSTDHIKHRILNRQSIIFLTIIVLGSLTSKLFLYDNSYDNPLFFSRYSTYGYYEIFPETILDSLHRGEKDVFTLSSDEIWNREGPEYEEIYWSQSDYLEIANALSQEVWDEPLDLKKWKVLSVSMNQDCMDNPRGFYDFRVVYFQDLGIKFWTRQYRVRSIEVFAWQGIIRWGNGTFSDAILPGWGDTHLTDFTVTADDALLISERRGGSKARQEVNNACGVSVWLNNFSPVSGYTNKKWLVNYQPTNFHTSIDPFSDKLKSGNTEQ